MGKFIKAVLLITAGILLIAFGNVHFAFLGKIFVAAGVSTIADAFAPKELDIRQGGLKIELSSSVAPRTLVYGRVRLAGARIAAFSHGADNKFLTMFYILAACECDSIDKYFVGDAEVTLDGSNLVSAGKYAGKIRIIHGLGTADQTANATLVSEITQWTTSHRLRGLCYMAVTWEFDREVFTQGRPTITVVLKGAKVLDTRTSSTAWSNNWALVMHDYLTRGGGSAWDIGCRLLTSEFIVANVNAEANISDENVTLKAGGTQKRYTADGVLRSTTVRETNLRAIISAGAGQLIYQAGFFNIYAGAAPSASVELDDDDLRGPVTLDTKRPTKDRTNRVIGVFLDATDDIYEENNYPPVVKAAYVTEDGGFVYEKRLDLPFTQSPIRAQRIAQIELERRRREYHMTYPCKWKGLQLQSWSTVNVTNSKYSFVSKEFQILQWNFIAQGIDLELQEHDSGIYAWDETTDEGTPLTTTSPTVDDGGTAPGVTGLAVASINITQGTAILPILVATWDLPSALVVNTEMQWKRNADSEWNPASSIFGASISRTSAGQFLPGESIDFRIRHINNFGVPSAWSTSSANIVGPDWVLNGGTATNTTNVDNRTAVDVAEISLGDLAETRWNSGHAFAGFEDEPRMVGPIFGGAGGDTLLVDPDNNDLLLPDGVTTVNDLTGGGADLGGILFNAWFALPKWTLGRGLRPLGWYLSGTTDDQSWSYVAGAFSQGLLKSSSDTSLRIASTAFLISITSAKYKIKVLLKGDAASSDGLYIRVQELDTNLPEGKLCVGWDISGSPDEDFLVLATRERIDLGFENVAVLTSITEYEIDYIPTSTAKWASVTILNWTGHGLDGIIIDRVTVDLLADITQDNIFAPTVSWNFQNTNDGFTVVNSTLTHQGDGTTKQEATAGDMQLNSPTGLTVNGSANFIVRARVTRKAGSGWDGTLFFGTSGHSFSASFKEVISDTTITDTPVILEWDMEVLTTGADNWITSTIDKLRFDLGVGADDDFIIDWIDIGRKSSSLMSEVWMWADPGDNFNWDTYEAGGWSPADVTQTITVRIMRGSVEIGSREINAVLDDAGAGEGDINITAGTSTGEANTVVISNDVSPAVSVVVTHTDSGQTKLVTFTAALPGYSGGPAK